VQNPLVKRDLVEAILELRADVEKQLQTNKYYVALNKLDELLVAIRPLEIVEVTVNSVRDSPSARAEAAPVAEPEAEPARTLSGVVQETVVEGEAARPS